MRDTDNSTITVKYFDSILSVTDRTKQQQKNH